MNQEINSNEKVIVGYNPQTGALLYMELSLYNMLHLVKD